MILSSPRRSWSWWTDLEANKSHVWLRLDVAFLNTKLEKDNMTKSFLKRQCEFTRWAKGHGAILFLGFDGVEYQGNLIQIRHGVAKVIYRGFQASHTMYVELSEWDRITLA